MNLVCRYANISLEGYPLNVLADIIAGKNQVKVKTVQSGVIVLSSGKVLKCMKNYFKRPEDTTKKSKLTHCFHIQKELGIESKINRCLECSTECITKLKEGSLIRR